MSGRIFISHATSDTALGQNIADFLGAMIEGVEVRAAASNHGPEAGDGSAALQQDLGDADVVVGLLTEGALAGGEVPFQLGAAWALGTRVLLLLAPDLAAQNSYLPIAGVELHALGPEALLELADALARDLGSSAEMGARAREALARQFPGFAGLDRQSTERPVSVPRGDPTEPQWPLEALGEAPPRASQPVPRAQLPSCSASLQAGRALGDCLMHREDGGRFAEELDAPFGSFLTSLGADWSALRKIKDLDVWVEAAQNVLQALRPEQRGLRCFYEVGFELATLINLAHRALETGEGDEPNGSWQNAWSALREAAIEAQVAPAAIDELRPMLENLYGPAPQRDFANLGRVQERVRELAAEADAAALAASA